MCTKCRLDQEDPCDARVIWFWQQSAKTTKKLEVEREEENAILHLIFQALAKCLRLVIVIAI